MTVYVLDWFLDQAFAFTDQQSFQNYATGLAFARKTLPVYETNRIATGFDLVSTTLNTSLEGEEHGEEVK